MTESKRVRNVSYVVWEFCKDKRGRLGFHEKLVSSRSDSEAFLRLVCLRCKHLRICRNGDYAACVFFARALRYKPCGNFALNPSLRDF
jgi:hypothetical protein